MKQKFITKRLSILLTVLMVLGIMPSGMTVHASEAVVTTEAELRSAVTSNDHIILAKDIELTTAMEIACKTITIDGEGHTISLNTGNTNRHFMLDNQASLTLQNVTLRGISGALGGGVSLQNDSKLYMEQSIIEFCMAERLGGGVYAYGGAKVDLSGSSIENCTAEYAGGVYIHEASADLREGSGIINCTATTGGGVYAYDNTALSLMGKSGIINCTATTGGGVAASKGSVELSEGSGILGCTADTGGGVWIVRGGSVKSDETTLYDGNQANTAYADKNDPDIQYACSSIVTSYENGLVYANPINGYDIYVKYKMGMEQDVVTLTWAESIDADEPFVRQYVYQDLTSVLADAAAFRFSQEKQVFLGWSLTQDLAIHTAGETFKFDKDYTFYGCWAAIEDKPNAIIDYVNETLIGLDANGDYMINETLYTADANGIIDIDPTWFETTLSIVKTGAVPAANSESQDLEIPARPGAPSVTGVGETTQGKNDGRITGTDSTMEYKSEETNWTACPDSDMENLTAGTYYVRLKATNNSFKSEAAEVIIAAGETAYTLTFETNGGTSITAISGVSGTIVDLADYITTREGYTFTGWYSDEELTTEVTSVTLAENTTVYAGWKQNQEPQDDIHYPYIAGYEDDTFKPNGPITRAETAQLLYNISGETASGTNPFSDVSDDAWYYNAVTFLADSGVISGYPDDTFRPDNTITRAEFVTLAAKFAELSSSSDSAFTDVPSNHWAFGYISAAYHAGWVSGCPGGTFEPNRSITRAEAVVILNAMLERAINEEFLSDLTMPFTDVQANHWAYYQILEAAVEHTHK